MSLLLGKSTFAARVQTPRNAACVRVAPFTPARAASSSSFLGEAPLVVGPVSVMKVTMMRHGNKVKHLGRPADQRKALIRSLVTQVIQHGAIRTTKVKAKVIRKYVDHMITLAKDGSLHARRQALAFIYDKELVGNLFTQVPARYAERNGGYTRIKTDTALRRGDATEMATIELV